MYQPSEFNNPRAIAIAEASEDASAAGDHEVADRLAMAAVRQEEGDEGTAELWLESVDFKVRQKIDRRVSALNAVAA